MRYKVEKLSKNQFLILGRTRFGTYEANGFLDQIQVYGDVQFQYNNHEVDMACALAYKGDFYILGGFDKPNR